MLLTSSIHHLDNDRAWLDEVRSLMTGLDRCEMALTLAWIARLGGESLVDRRDEKEALATLRGMGLALEEARSGAVALKDVRD
jgi:hypothetical protein